MSCSRGRANTDPRPILHEPSPPPASGSFKNHSFLFKEEQKYINKSNRSLWFYQKEGGRETPVPTSCLWKEPLIPSWEHCPGAQGGLPLTQFLTRPPGLGAEVVGIGSNKEALSDQRKKTSSQEDQG